MSTFKPISDSIEDLSGGQIVKKKRKAIVPVICIIAGLLFMWWGISKWTQIGYELTCYVLVFGGLFIVGWGIVMLTFNTHYYVVAETEEPIHPQKVYLNPDSKEVISELMKSGNLEAVLSHAIKTKSPLMLELWQADSHKLLYSQLVYSLHAHPEPISDALVTEKDKRSS